MWAYQCLYGHIDICLYSAAFPNTKFNNTLKKNSIFRSLPDRSNMIENSENQKKLIFEAPI